MNDMPVPLRCTLPNQNWVVESEGSSDDSVALVAARGNLVHEFVPTITLGGEQNDDPATLLEIADASLKAGADGGASVELLDRQMLGSAAAPGLTQALAISGSPEGRGFDLRRSEVLLELLDMGAPTKRVVVRAALTCTADQFTETAREFQSFVASLSTVPRSAPERS